MYPGIVIQPLSNEYGKSIIDLIEPILHAEFNMFLSSEAQAGLLNIEIHYKQNGGVFWGALYDGELVGTIALIATGHEAGAIQKMFVKKECRGVAMGIAQQLLNTLVEHCSNHHITNLYLGTVDSMKAACRFYERNGFEIIQRSMLPSYYPVMACDNVYYHLQINSQQNNYHSPLPL